MFYLKGCPKCRGDVYESADIYGPYASCMQCSHYLTEAEKMRLNRFSLSRPINLTTVAWEEPVAA